MKFGKEELKKGTDREMEHTDSRKEAAKIAKDHLKEKPDYYTKLDKCIPESKGENIQELSQDTLKNYKKKSLAHAATHANAARGAFDNDDIKGMKHHENKRNRRYKGAAMADKKIVKEEETLEEAPNSSRKGKKKFGPGGWFAKSKKTGIAITKDSKVKKSVKEGVNGEHGPDEDEDQPDRIERKRLEKSKKAAAKVKAIKMAAKK